MKIDAERSAFSGISAEKMLASDANRMERVRSGHGRTGSIERTLEKKTIKERTRRDKINTSILELKEIIRDSVDLSSRDFSKLEKADILELVIQTIKSPPPSTSAIAHSTEVFDFKSDVELCADETIKYLQHYATSADHPTDPIVSQHCQRILSERVHDLKQSILSKETPISTPAHVEPIIPEPPSSHARIATSTDGVLLDLSCNSRRNQLPAAFITGMAPAPSTTQPKREVLLKIRRKIFEKRNAQHYRRMMDGDSSTMSMDEYGFMWRPW